MIALDTNILVRYLVQDDLAQAQIAKKIIEGLNAKEPAFISNIVLCELNWVLKNSYKIVKNQRIEILDNITSVAEFKVERVGLVLTALRNYKEGSADFSDYMILEIAKDNGYDELVTFDKKASKSKGFKLAI